MWDVSTLTSLAENARAFLEEAEDDEGLAAGAKKDLERDVDVKVADPVALLVLGFSGCLKRLRVRPNAVPGESCSVSDADAEEAESVRVRLGADAEESREIVWD